jgi:hypothetical protein
MRLYTENIVGPIDYFENIDAALRQNLGYMIRSPEEAALIFELRNRRMWQD